MNIPLGIESSNGSLGHGLSLGIGIALAAKKEKIRSTRFTFLLVMENVMRVQFGKL